MSKINNYVICYILMQHAKTAGIAKRKEQKSIFTGSNKEEVLSVQEKAAKAFIEEQERNGISATIVSSFCEIPENKRTNKWPKLMAAINACKENDATLLIPELGTSINNESFVGTLLESGISFHCCDQAFVTQSNLKDIAIFLQLQRQNHGKRIREGLKMTSAKSGNPNAAEVIRRVNQPKIDTAIIFAFLLEPLIQDYRVKGYSQRQMVKALNEEGFTAPEGGKWVLSQLQKVLDRVKLNEIAEELRGTIETYRQDNLLNSEIADKLNSANVASFKKSTWNEVQVQKLIDRLDQINEIVVLNNLVLNLIPLLKACRNNHLTNTDLLNEIYKASLKSRSTETETA